MAGVLSGQVAVVAGGAGGIGRAFAAAARGEGARTCCWDMALPAAGHGYERAFEVDVTREDRVADALAASLAAFGKVDIFVNSVGITGPVALTRDYALDDWQRVIAVNLTGAFICCKAIVPVMRERNYGRIVNVSSIAGKEGNPNQVAYSAAKAGVIALTKSLGKELATTGIRVNCVTPAFTATDLIHQMTQAQRDLVLEKIPMGRPGEPDEIAALILWLASPACAFSTAATFDASGGRATY